MTDFIKVQGWCPTAWKPMRAQDGWIVRVRPHCASISAGQWAKLAKLAQAYANPQIELTRLGNVQLRGVSDKHLSLVRSQLITAQLVPAEEDADLAPAVHCTAFYSVNDMTHRLAKAVSLAVLERLRPRALQRLGLSALPSKFGLLVDDERLSLSGVGADLRVWVLAGGGYGLALGNTTSWYRFASAEQVVDAAIQISTWFARERMATFDKPPTRLQSVLQYRHPDVPALKAALPQIAQAHDAEPIAPGAYAQGWVLGVPLGRIDAQALLTLAAGLPADTEIRVTPWRSLLLLSEDAQQHIAPLDAAHWITDSTDARLRVSACTGSPRCEQAHIPAQAMALQLASHVAEGGHLHVSGCAKFCALSSDATSVISAGVAASGEVLLSLGSAKQQGQLEIQIPYQAWLAAPAELQQHLHDLPL